MGRIPAWLPTKTSQPGEVSTGAGARARARASALQLELLPDETSKVLEAKASPGSCRQKRLQPAWRALIPTAEGPIPLTTGAAAYSTQPVGRSPTSLAGPPCTEAN